MYPHTNLYPTLLDIKVKMQYLVQCTRTRVRKNESVGNGRQRSHATKQHFFCRAKVRSPTVSNRFPLDTFGPSKKKTALRGNVFFKKCGLGKFWPDHVSDCFRPLPTVSFFLND